MSTNRKATFKQIFGSSEEASDHSSIAKQFENNANYNTMGNVSFIMKSNSMETVWAYDQTIRVGSSSRQNLSGDDNDYGIPPALPTTHMQEDEYHPYNHINNDSPVSYWGTVFHLVMVSAGPAMLSIPIVFMQVGYLPAFFMTIGLLLFYAYVMHMVAWSEYQICREKRIPHLPYQDVLYYAFKDGPDSVQWLASSVRMLINVVFIVLWMSACCFGVVMIGENLQLVYNQVNRANLSLHPIMICTLFPILALCYIPKLKYLVPFSLVGNTFNVLCILAVFYDIFFDAKPFKGANAFGELSSVPLFLGSVLFTINATGIIMPLKNEMERPGRFDGVLGVLGVTYIPVSLVYAFFGLFCSLKYGSAMHENVITDIGGNGFFSYTMILLNTLALTFQYPLLSYVVLDVLWNNILKEHKKLWDNLICREYAVRTCIVLVAFGIAFAVPNVPFFLSLGGTIFTALDSMIFPALMQSLVMWRVCKNKCKLYRCWAKNALIIMGGVVLMVFGTLDSIHEVEKGDNEDATS